MISENFIIYSLLILSIFTFSCSDKEDQGDSTYYAEWTSVGDGLSANVTKNVLTEFVGSTKCPYCPATDSLLLSYFNSGHDVRFEEGSWYNISGVPTTFTNGSWSSVNPDMAVIPMSESTPLQMSLDGTKIDGMDVTVRVSISSSLDMRSSDSLCLFIAATMDNVYYEGSNGEPHHQDVFLGWINEGLSGELLSLGNEKVVKSYSWEMPSNWPQNNFETSWWQVEWDPVNLAVVAFIQNKYTREILQVTGTD